MNEIQALRERAKELSRLYAIDAGLSNRKQTPVCAFQRILPKIPEGWQHPDSTGACIEYLGHRYVGPGFSPAGGPEGRDAGGGDHALAVRTPQFWVPESEDRIAVDARHDTPLASK